MPSRSRKSRKPATTKVAAATRHSPDLSFPVSHREQQRYLELADIFLEKKSSPSNVIRIDSRARGNSRKAA